MIEFLEAIQGVTLTAIALAVAVVYLCMVWTAFTEISEVLSGARDWNKCPTVVYFFVSSALILLTLSTFLLMVMR